MGCIDIEGKIQLSLSLYTLYINPTERFNESNLVYINRQLLVIVVVYFLALLLLFKQGNITKIQKILGTGISLCGKW